jgi:uridine phosphorylase
MEWFDPDDDVVIRPETDRVRFWQQKFGCDLIDIAPQLLFVNNGHGKLFDAVCGQLDEQAQILHDFRGGGYCHYRLANSHSLTVYRAPEPAPYAAHALEHVISAGAQQIVFLNGTGSLREDLPVGTLLLPDELVREEGTSYHYVPSGVFLRTHEALNVRIQRAADRLAIPLVPGKHWTTDAIYRETWVKIDRYRALGVNSVEMELSALAAVACFRQCELSSILVVTDVCGQNHTWNEIDSTRFREGVWNAAQLAVQVFM